MSVWPLTAFLTVLIILLKNDHEWPVLVVFGFLSHTGILFVLKSKGQRSLIRTCAIPLVTLAVFILLLMVRSDLDRPVFEEMPDYLTGVVHDVPVLTASGNSRRFVMKEDGTGGRVQVYLNEQESASPTVTAGMTCRITAPDLVQPEPPGNPHGFDYGRFLERDKIFFQTFISPGQLSCLPEKAGGYYRLIRFRGQAMERVDIAIGETSPKTAALVLALVYGDRSSVDPSVIEAYQRLGVIHLLAVSGLHVGLLTLAMNSLLLRLGITRERALWILLAMLPVYMILAGGAPSVMRASLTVAAVILAAKSGWKLKAVDGISIVFIALLTVNPYYLYHVGFQLSFLTSFALIMSSPLLSQGNRITQLMKVTLAAQIIAAPVMISIFFEWSLFAVFMNLLMVPAVTIFLLPGAFLTVFGLWLWPSVTVKVTGLTEMLLSVMDGFLLWTSESAYSSLLFGKPDTWMLLVLCAGSAGFFLLWEKSGRYAFTKGFTVFLAVLTFVYVQPYLDRGATVTFLDVGQGDAAVIELPHRQGVYIVDTGGVPSWHHHESSGPFDYDIEPFLRGQGISSVDLLVLTHGHEDHVGEVCKLSDRFRIKKAIYGGAMDQEQIMKDSLRCLNEQGTSISRGQRGMAWYEGGSGFRIIHPNDEGTLSENDLSLVLDSHIEGVSFLFTGDIESDVETELVQEELIRSVQILKVAHHGSHTSSGEAFLSRAMPAISIISAGENNRYGHPHEEVVERLSQFGAGSFSTADTGAVQIRVKNGEWSVKVHKK
ncbi:DNA internalization-related competence protein ComEC/Rec2 [Salisediminibacterium selenitireducens]|uniref:DNA internalization-related competence protein ComEC/Rec2 n=1 Tax=Bacillus selenitireducens (strain ATCC 700615 / DSM 15326 / MLS10) TaxID=439292 RepID=D6XWC4_BACIE|nr:DNA internalization-related competence protein ComEC/Rec2 [Salisediminibacterium selenitireducens]ADH99878.1 DNA internalization-related competence protein ComEC/Rec2 [[Bacillus] selenitireducens MLS10]